MLRKFLAAAILALFATQAHAAKLFISEYNSLVVTAGQIAQVGAAGTGLQNLSYCESLI